MSPRTSPRPGTEIKQFYVKVNVKTLLLISISLRQENVGVLLKESSDTLSNKMKWRKPKQFSFCKEKLKSYPFFNCCSIQRTIIQKWKYPFIKYREHHTGDIQPWRAHVLSRSTGRGVSITSQGINWFCSSITDALPQMPPANSKGRVMRFTQSTFSLSIILPFPVSNLLTKTLPTFQDLRFCFVAAFLGKEL